MPFWACLSNYNGIVKIYFNQLISYKVNTVQIGFVKMSSALTLRGFICSDFLYLVIIILRCQLRLHINIFYPGPHSRLLLLLLLYKLPT